MKVFSILDPDELTVSQPSSYYTISDSCLVTRAKPLFLPEWDTDFRAIPCVAVRIGKLGKCIAERFAGRYIDGIGAAITVRGCDTLALLSKHNKPLDRALSFDGAAAVGEFLKPDNELTQCVVDMNFKIGEESIFSSEMDILPVAGRFLSFVSAFNKMQTGDLLLIPVSEIPVPIQTGMNLEGVIRFADAGGYSDEKKLICRIR